MLAPCTCAAASASRPGLRRGLEPTSRRGCGGSTSNRRGVLGDVLLGRHGHLPASSAGGAHHRAPGVRITPHRPAVGVADNMTVVPVISAKGASATPTRDPRARHTRQVGRRHSGLPARATLGRCRFKRGNPHSWTATETGLSCPPVSQSTEACGTVRRTAKQ